MKTHNLAFEANGFCSVFAYHSSYIDVKKERSELKLLGLFHTYHEVVVAFDDDAGWGRRIRTEVGGSATKQRLNALKRIQGGTF